MTFVTWDWSRTDFLAFITFLFEYNEFILLLQLPLARMYLIYGIQKRPFLSTVKYETVQSVMQNRWKYFHIIQMYTIFIATFLLAVPSNNFTMKYIIGPKIFECEELRVFLIFSSWGTVWNYWKITGKALKKSKKNESCCACALKRTQKWIFLKKTNAYSKPKNEIMGSICLI